MARTLVRRIALGALAVLLVGGAVLVFTVRGDLDDARGTAEDRWEPLATALDPRYEAVDALRAAAVEAGGIRGGAAEGSPDLLDALAAASADWRAGRDGPVADQVEAANALEGLALRLIGTVEASARLDEDPQVQEALGALRALDEPAERPDAARRAYNDAAAAYEDERGGPVRGLIASVLGYDAPAALDLLDLSDRSEDGSPADEADDPPADGGSDDAGTAPDEPAG